MDLVFEIGTEELPASFQRKAVRELNQRICDELFACGFHSTPAAGTSSDAPTDEGDVSHPKLFCTPRRLAVAIDKIREHSQPPPTLLQGPPLKVAFSPDGLLTKAGEAFTKKAKLIPDYFKTQADFERQGLVVGERLLVRLPAASKSAHDDLPTILAETMRRIPFAKAMRWGDESATFARPVQWIAATLDGQLLAFTFADVKSGVTTRGHRFDSPGEFALPLLADYVETMRTHGVSVDWDTRKALVRAEVQRAAAEFAPGAEPLPDEELFETVTGLVEKPTGVLGSFAAHFLELPPEVLVSEMRGHQKYFAVRDAASGKLLPAFVAVSNTKVKDPAVSRRGYERVLRARLSDGRFFFDEDRKVTLASRLPRLERIVFFQGLGSQGDRVKRLQTLAGWLHQQTGWGSQADLDQAAQLAKTDLTCGMVGEFPELQGIMGATYARLEKKPVNVYEAIEQHYWPKSAEAAIPRVGEGTLLALADRLDQLVGFFGVGKEPTGTSDPFALRRATIGMLRILLETTAAAATTTAAPASGTAMHLRLDLRAALAEAQQCHGATVGSKVSQEPALIDKVWAFVTGRLEVLWKDRAPADAIAAALGTGARDIVLLQKRLDALVAERTAQPERFAAAAGAFKRIGNILGQATEKKLPATGFDLALARLPSEQALAQAHARAAAQVQAAAAREEFASAWAELAELRPAVDRFFDEVMVMDPDPAVRDNRLALLRRVHELFAPLAEFGKLQT